MSGSRAPVAPGFDVGVVVVSYNTRELLDACLASLAGALTNGTPSAEVVVVDNASSDESAAMVAAKHPWVQLDIAPGNLGYAAANNRALRRWLAMPEKDAPRWALVLNPDTEVHPRALATLVDALEADRGAAVAGPALVYPDGRFQHAAFSFPGVAQTALDLFPISRLMDSRFNGRYPPARYRAGQPFRVDFPLGACMLARLSAVRQVGVMDEAYFMYCEEIDWCRRFRSGGYHALCVPAATVMHHAGASTRQFRAEMFGALWRSRLRYFRHHEPWPRRLMLTALVRAGLAAHALSDRSAAQLGRLAESERDERAAAYRAALDGPEG